jgi:hypothetical protein
MKASDKPEISKKWWTSEKPDDIKGQDLEKALASAEKALSDADKKGDADSIDNCLAQLKALGAAADKTIKKECDKKKHKEVIAVLEKYEKLIGEEVQRLEQAKAALAKEKGGDEEDEEDEKGVLKPEYLGRMIKQLRSGKELNFCFGLNRSTPDDSRLVLCNKRKPERLLKILKRTGDFSNRLLTYGYALGDGKVLEFRLADDAKEPSQIVKLAKEFLKGNRELKFKKLRVLVGGETFEEDMPESGGPDEPQVAAGAAGDLQQRLRSAAAAAQTWKQTHENVADQIAMLRRELDAFDDPDVASVRDRLGSALDRYPKLDFSGLAGATDQAAYDRTLEQTRARVAQWRRLLDQDPALRAIDENPFVNTNVVRTFGDALDRIAGELKV